MPSVAGDEELIELVYAEARLIDEKRLEQWYELYAEDGRYWMPLTRDQKSPTTENSLMYEDKLLLQLRIQRLRNPNAHSQAQPSWCQHVLQAPSIEDRGSISGVAILEGVDTNLIQLSSRLPPNLASASFSPDSPACPNGGWPRSCASASASVRSSSRSSRRAIERAICATSSECVSRVR